MRFFSKRFRVWNTGSSRQLLRQLYAAPLAVLALFVFLLGILSIVYCALRLAWAFKGGGLGTAILGILTIALGILLLVNPYAGAVVLPWIYGVFFIIGGIAALVWGIRMRSE